MVNDLVGKRMFFELLHLDRTMKKMALEFRLVHLAGYRAALVRHKEDLEIADNTRDYWANLNEGSESYTGIG